MDCVELSLEKLEHKCRDFAEEIQNSFSPDLVIYVAKGGYLIGKYMNSVFKVDMLGIVATRKGNDLKSFVAPVLALLPRCLCNFLRKVELKSNIHKKSNQKAIDFKIDTTKLNMESIKNILILDDSIDTGNSMKSVLGAVKQNFPDAVTKIAVINVMTPSENVIKADYWCYKDAMLRTPMSKDSREYTEFVRIYKSECQ